jgi:hypothetical protein
MDPQLVAIHPHGKHCLIGHKLRQLISGRGLRWCWPVALDQTENAFTVEFEDYSRYPHPVPFDYLGVGLGEEKPRICSSCYSRNMART